MSGTITIIDYGLGNLFSVARAFEHIGAKIALVSNPDEIRKADKLLLPGVGAFNKGMEELNSRGLSEAIKEYAASGKALFGICLGMQMLFDESEENGHCKGLGLIKGKVAKIPASGVDGAEVKIPHIGWTKLYRNGEPQLLNGVSEDSSFYFVHSYHANCSDNADLAAYALYGGNKITACVEKANIFGCQFHPEKSAEAGLAICRNFLKI